MSEIRDWELERLVLGELDAGRAEAIRSELDRDASQRARLEALYRSDEEVLREHPPESMARAIRDRRRGELAARSVPGRKGLLVLAPALITAAVLVAVIAPDGTVPPGLAPPEVTRIKGEPAIHVFRHGARADQRLAEGSLARAGELLQLRYSPGSCGGHGTCRHGVIVSVDGAGNATLHFPETVGASTALAPAGASLGTSYELDAAPGFERFIFVAAETPLSPADVLARARALAHSPGARTAPLDLGPEVKQDSFVVRKAP